MWGCCCQRVQKQHWLKGGGRPLSRGGRGLLAPRKELSPPCHGFQGRRWKPHSLKGKSSSFCRSGCPEPSPPGLRRLIWLWSQVPCLCAEHFSLPADAGTFPQAKILDPLPNPWLVGRGLPQLLHPWERYLPTPQTSVHHRCTRCHDFTRAGQGLLRSGAPQTGPKGQRSPCLPLTGGL